MPTTSLQCGLSEAQPSSNAEQGVCSSFDEAIKLLPKLLQSKHEHELKMFLSQVNELHKPHGRHASAWSILNYIRRILEAAPERGELASEQGTRSKAFESLPELELPIITEEIASEIASMVADDVDPHNITISVLNILQRYSWETKVALMIATYILTFGDFGLNLCTESKVSLDNIPMFVKQLLDITRCIVEFEELPTTYMTSMLPDVENTRTQYIVAIYWIIRIVVVNAASNIKTMSSSGYKFGTPISPPSNKKLDAIKSHLETRILLLKKILGSKTKKLQNHTAKMEKLMGDIATKVYEQEDTKGWTLADFYRAVCKTVVEINSSCGYSQIRLPKEEILRLAFDKHHKGKGMAMTKEELQSILQDVFSWETELLFTGSNAKDFLLYIFGVLVTSLLMQQIFMPTEFLNGFLVPVITSTIVFVLVKLNLWRS